MTRKKKPASKSKKKRTAKGGGPGVSVVEAVQNANALRGSRRTMFDDGEAVHWWFELSYAQYLTIPRSALQSMPAEWQRRFVDCLCQLDNTIDWRPKSGTYCVELRELEDVLDPDDPDFPQRWGKTLEDPLQDYERGSRVLPYRKGIIEVDEDTAAAAKAARFVHFSRDQQYGDFAEHPDTECTDDELRDIMRRQVNDTIPENRRCLVEWAIKRTDKKLYVAWLYPGNRRTYETAQELLDACLAAQDKGDK